MQTPPILPRPPPWDPTCKEFRRRNSCHWKLLSVKKVILGNTMFMQKDFFSGRLLWGIESSSPRKSNPREGLPGKEALETPRRTPLPWNFPAFTGCHQTSRKGARQGLGAAPTPLPPQPQPGRGRARRDRADGTVQPFCASCVCHTHAVHLFTVGQDLRRYTEDSQNPNALALWGHHLLGSFSWT